MVLAEISIKLIFLPKRKESSVPHLVVQIHVMAPMACLRAFTSSSLCTEACIFLSIYRSILILFSVNHGRGQLLLQNYYKFSSRYLNCFKFSRFFFITAASQEVQCCSPVYYMACLKHSQQRNSWKVIAFNKITKTLYLQSFHLLQQTRKTDSNLVAIVTKVVFSSCCFCFFMIAQ